MTKPRGVAHRAVKSVTIEELSKHFHLPINDVATKLGVCVTVLKQRCREHGIARWPYRKVRKLDTLISSLQTLVTPEKLSPEQVVAERQRKLNCAVETRSFLLSNPNSSAHLKLGKVKARSLQNSADSSARSDSVLIDRLGGAVGSGNYSEVCSSAMGLGLDSPGASLHRFNTSLSQNSYQSEGCQPRSHVQWLAREVGGFQPYPMFSESRGVGCDSGSEKRQVLVDFLGKMESSLAPDLSINEEPEPKNLATLYSMENSKIESRKRLWGLDFSSSYEPAPPQTSFCPPESRENYFPSRFGGTPYQTASNCGGLFRLESEGSSAFSCLVEQPRQLDRIQEHVDEGMASGAFLSLSCAPVVQVKESDRRD